MGSFRCRVRRAVGLSAPPAPPLRRCCFVGKWVEVGPSSRIYCIEACREGGGMQTKELSSPPSSPPPDPFRPPVKRGKRPFLPSLPPPPPNWIALQASRAEEEKGIERDTLCHRTDGVWQSGEPELTARDIGRLLKWETILRTRKRCSRWGKFFGLSAT